MVETIEFTLKKAGKILGKKDLDAKTRPPTQQDDFEDWLYNTPILVEAGSFKIVVLVEESDLEGNINQKVNGLVIELSKPDPHLEGHHFVDVFYEGLMKETNQGKKFSIMDLELPEEGEGARISKPNAKGERKLIIKRGDYYNIIEPIEDNGEPIVEKWDCPDDDKIDNASDNEYDELIKKYNNARKNHRMVREFKQFADQVNSTGIYYEIESYADWNDTFNALQPEARLGTSSYFPEAKERSGTGVETKASFERLVKQLQKGIDYKRPQLENLKKVVQKWKSEGNLTDREHNQEIEEWKKINESEIFKDYEDLKSKVNGNDPKYSKYKDEFNNKSSGESEPGISASEDLVALVNSSKTEMVIIAEQDFHLVDAVASKVNIKGKFKNWRKKANKILAAKKEVIDWFRANKCPQCKDSFPSLPISYNGKNYCSQECKNNADSGQNKYTCAGCEKEKTDTPTIQGGKKYCSDCSTKNQTLDQTKTDAIQKIKTALDQKPEIKTTDLDASFQNWETQINGFSKTDDINNLKSRVLSNITKKRNEKKAQEEYDKEAKDLKNKRGADLRDSIKKLEVFEGTKTYNKAEIEEALDRAWDEDQEESKSLVKDTVEAKMTKCGVKEDELGSEEKQILSKIRNKEYQDKNQLKTDKNKLVEFIGNKEVDKRIVALQQEVDAASKPEEKEVVKNELLKMLEENNVYIERRENDIRNLISKLDQSSPHGPTTNPPPSNFPWNMVLPLGAVAIVGIIGLGFLIVRKRSKQEEEE